MYNDNIPEGFDENGVRNGNGQWRDDEEEEGEVNLDDYEPIAVGDYVECHRCARLIPISEAVSIKGGTGYMCDVCADDMGIT